MQKYNNGHKPGRPPKKIDIGLVVKRYQAGYSMRQLAKTTNVSPATIYWTIHRYDYAVSKNYTDPINAIENNLVTLKEVKKARKRCKGC